MTIGPQSSGVNEDISHVGQLKNNWLKISLCIVGQWAGNPYVIIIVWNAELCRYKYRFQIVKKIRVSLKER